MNLSIFLAKISLKLRLDSLFAIWDFLQINSCSLDPTTNSETTIWILSKMIALLNGSNHEFRNYDLKFVWCSSQIYQCYNQMSTLIILDIFLFEWLLTWYNFNWNHFANIDVHMPLICVMLKFNSSCISKSISYKSCIERFYERVST